MPDRPTPDHVISRTMPITIQGGLLVAMIVGVWLLAFRVAEFTAEMDDIQRAIQGQWTYQMERESWREYERTGKAPNVTAIKETFQLP